MALLGSRSLVLSFALLASCERHEPASRLSDAAATPASAVAPSPTNDPAPGPTREPEALEAEARALLKQWADAQNGGDFAVYQRLYGTRFTGVKRSGPRTRNYDRRGWLADRQQMFAKPMQVEFAIERLSAQGSTVSVLGSQSFRMANYQDRGQKSFTLLREGGSLRIVREEMLASELGPAPAVAARMVVAVPEGPTLVIVARAPGQLMRGETVSSHAASPAAVVVQADASGAPAEAARFLAGDVQLIGASGSCTTRAKALRVAHVAYAHFGQVASWRGEDPRVPKPDHAELERQIRELDPQGFWAVELVDRCVPEPLVAVPSRAAIAVYARAELPPADSDLPQRFAKLPFVRSLSEDERAQAVQDLTLTKFSAGARAWVSAESVSGCSAPVLHALFDAEHGDKLGLAGDAGGLEHVEAVADLDGDGSPELIMRSAIGADRWGITDPRGTIKLLLELPYFDCPC